MRVTVKRLLSSLVVQTSFLDLSNSVKEIFELTKPLARLPR